MLDYYAQKLYLHKLNLDPTPHAGDARVTFCKCDNHPIFLYTSALIASPLMGLNFPMPRSRGAR